MGKYRARQSRGKKHTHSRRKPAAACDADESGDGDDPTATGQDEPGTHPSPQVKSLAPADIEASNAEEGLTRRTEASQKAEPKKRRTQEPRPQTYGADHDVDAWASGSRASGSWESSSWHGGGQLTQETIAEPLLEHFMGVS